MGIICSCLSDEYTEFSNSKEEQPRKYSDELVNFIKHISLESDFGTYTELEEDMAKSFENSTEVNNCLVYLLLDPRKLALIRSNNSLGNNFKIFLSAVFYIGKGQERRPFKHFTEVEKSDENSNEKLEMIKEIWSRKREDHNCVIVLPYFRQITSKEAATREASMIDAIGLENIKNRRRGTYYGNTKEKDPTTKKDLGSLCLYKVFCNYEDEESITQYEVIKSEFSEGV